jgi:hypothetical protein
MDIGQAITHEIDKPDSKLIGAVSIGWPKILSVLPPWVSGTRCSNAQPAPRDPASR